MHRPHLNARPTATLATLATVAMVAALTLGAGALLADDNAAQPASTPGGWRGTGEPARAPDRAADDGDSDDAGGFVVPRIEDEAPHRHRRSHPAADPDPSPSAERDRGPYDTHRHVDGRNSRWVFLYRLRGTVVRVLEPEIGSTVMGEVAAGPGFLFRPSGRNPASLLALRPVAGWEVGSRKPHRPEHRKLLLRGEFCRMEIMGSPFKGHGGERLEMFNSWVGWGIELEGGYVDMRMPADGPRRSGVRAGVRATSTFLFDMRLGFAVEHFAAGTLTEYSVELAIPARTGYHWSFGWGFRGRNLRGWRQDAITVFIQLGF